MDLNNHIIKELNSLYKIKHPHKDSSLLCDEDAMNLFVGLFKTYIREREDSVCDELSMLVLQEQAYKYAFNAIRHRAYKGANIWSSLSSFFKNKKQAL